MADKSLLKEFINDNKPAIDDYLSNNLDEYVDQKDLLDSMKYSLMAGGKRLRPLFTIAVMKMMNKKIEDDQMKAACALELLHTYSLIHDDLPAMDNDDLRRGKPTNHVIYGAGLATLAGDGLLTLAFQWLTDNNMNDSIKSKLALLLSKAAGPSGMVSGQAKDIQNENKKLILDQLKCLHHEKTGALIRYALAAGAVMSEADNDLERKLDKFGSDYGLAFQIYDDILDVVSNDKELGKPVHQDGNKNTYINLLGLDKSYDYLKQLIDDCRKVLDDINTQYKLDTSVLSAFLDYFEIKK